MSNSHALLTLGSASMFDKGWPDNSVVIKHFQDAAIKLYQLDNFAELFTIHVLRPFEKAMSKFRNIKGTGMSLPFPASGNPFIAGIFSSADGFPPIWETLMNSLNIYSEKSPEVIYQPKLLLAILYTWGFADHETYGWTAANGPALYKVLDAQGFIAEATKFSW
jgi:hypothetical protein